MTTAGMDGSEQYTVPVFCAYLFENIVIALRFFSSTSDMACLGGAPVRSRGCRSPRATGPWWLGARNARAPTASIRLTASSSARRE